MLIEEIREGKSRPVDQLFYFIQKTFDFKPDNLEGHNRAILLHAIRWTVIDISSYYMGFQDDGEIIILMD